MEVVRLLPPHESLCQAQLTACPALTEAWAMPAPILGTHPEAKLHPLAQTYPAGAKTCGQQGRLPGPEGPRGEQASLQAPALLGPFLSSTIQLSSGRDRTQHRPLQFCNQNLLSTRMIKLSNQPGNCLRVIRARGYYCQ